MSGRLVVSVARSKWSTIRHDSGFIQIMDVCFVAVLLDDHSIFLLEGGARIRCCIVLHVVVPWLVGMPVSRVSIGQVS